MSELTIRAERVEIRALESLHRACPEELGKEQGLEWLEIGSVRASLCRADPSILLNRAAGLGLDEAVTANGMKAVLEAYSSRGIDDWFFHVHDENIDDACRALLAPPAMHPRRGWMRFVYERPAGRPVQTQLAVEQVAPETAHEFATIVGEGFGLDAASEPLLAALVNDERWHLFLSRDGATAAGAGGLFVDGEYGWLDWAATSPAYRRRGSQTAILSARLDRAGELGCRAVFTETGEAVAGDPQHSYGNILKAGFKVLGARANYSPRPAPA